MVEARKSPEESYNYAAPARKYTLYAYARDQKIPTGSAYQFGARVELENPADLTSTDIEALLRYQEEIRTNGRHVKPGYGSVAKELGVSRSAVHHYAEMLGIHTSKPSLEDLDKIRGYREKLLEKRSAK